jgi:hypothetical protein
MADALALLERNVGKSMLGGTGDPWQGIPLLMLELSRVDDREATTRVPVEGGVNITPVARTFALITGMIADPFATVAAAARIPEIVIVVGVIDGDGTV